MFKVTTTVKIIDTRTGNEMEREVSHYEMETLSRADVDRLGESYVDGVYALGCDVKLKPVRDGFNLVHDIAENMERDRRKLTGHPVQEHLTGGATSL